MTGNQYDHLWKNPDNWGPGWAGWYFCKDDPRLWVPKKVPALGITLNLAHPKGGIMLVGIFLLPTFFLMAALLLNIAVMMKVCG